MIYFIQAEELGHIKIGFTDEDDAFGRLADLQVGSPVRLHLLGTIDGSHEDEQLMHERFAQARLHGEWFRPIPQLIQVIRSRLRTQGIDCQLSSRAPERKLLKVKDVATKLGISDEQVLYFINSGRLKAANFGRGLIRPRWRVEENALEEFVAARTRQNAPVQRERKPRKSDVPQYV